MDPLLDPNGRVSSELRAELRVVQFRCSNERDVSLRNNVSEWKAVARILVRDAHDQSEMASHQLLLRGDVAF
jgi:hypothetical protein